MLVRPIEGRERRPENVARPQSRPSLLDESTYQIVAIVPWTNWTNSCHGQGNPKTHLPADLYTAGQRFQSGNCGVVNFGLDRIGPVLPDTLGWGLA